MFAPTALLGVTGNTDFLEAWFAIKSARCNRDLHNRHVTSPLPVKEGNWVPPKRLLKVALGHNSVTTEYLYA